MKKLITLVLMASFSTSLFAQVLYVSKGDPAPYNGYIFTLGAELDNRKKLEDLKTLVLVEANDKKIIDMKDLYITESNTEMNIWKTQAQDLSKQLAEQSNSSFWHSVLYFGLGVVASTAMAFAVSRASR